MIDILMITHNRLEYLKKALPSVLNQTYKDFKLTIWDNASDKETIDYLHTLPDSIRIIFSPTNHPLAFVTTRMFLKEFKSDFVGKVDSDIIFPPDWIERIMAKHQEKHYGFLGGFHFRPEDISELNPIIENGVWHKHNIGGNFIIRREDFKGYEGFAVWGLSEYQAEMGFPNGYLWDPILWIEHMEDARSEHYINTKEYNDYKKKTRGISLDTYQTGIVNMNYLRENTVDK